MTQGSDVANACLAALVSTVKNRQIFGLESWSAFNRHVAADYDIGLFNLIFGEAQSFQILARAQNVCAEGLIQVKHGR